jgi:hypothetical protein
MEGLKSLGKCVGRACGLQGSEFHTVYDELKEITKLGPNTQTRKNRLSRVGARLNSLAATRAAKTNLAKINSLRLAHNVLNAQRSNAVLNSRNLLSRYAALKARKNKHETDQLVQELLAQEIKPIQKIAKNFEVEKYLTNLSKKAGPVEDPKVVQMRKSRNVILKQFPRIKDEDMLRLFLDTRLLALTAEVTDEDEVARNPKKAAAVQKFFTDRISKIFEAGNKTYGPKMYTLPTPPGAAGAGTGTARRNRRKTRKAGRR